jgi:hypothetical protein
LSLETLEQDELDVIQGEYEKLADEAKADLKQGMLDTGSSDVER